MTLSQYTEEIHMAVWDITQYELVPAPEFPAPLPPGISVLQGKSSCYGVFAELF